MRWDPTVSLGTILAMVGICITVISVYISLRVQLVQFEQAFHDVVRRVVDLEESQAKVQEIIMRQSGILQRMIGRLEVLHPEQRGVKDPE